MEQEPVNEAGINKPIWTGSHSMYSLTGPERGMTYISNCVQYDWFIHNF